MPYGEVVLATFFWAMSAPYVRWIGFPPTYLTFIRCIVPLAIAGVWVIRTAHWRRLVTRSSRAGIWNRYTLFASLCNLVRSLLYFWGFILLPAGHAILLIYTWPIMVAALSSVVLDEPFHPFQMAMGLLALAGMAVIQFDPSTLATPNIWLGSVVVLGVAAANAGMLLAFKRNPHPLTPLETIVIQNSSGALFFLPIGLTMAPIFPWTRTAVSVVMA
ncbi:EamA family transporter, partial [bacterium]|nr:EamA family transporter [bacterium]